VREATRQDKTAKCKRQILCLRGATRETRNLTSTQIPIYHNSLSSVSSSLRSLLSSLDWNIITSRRLSTRHNNKLLIFVNRFTRQNTTKLLSFARLVVEILSFDIVTSQRIRREDENMKILTFSFASTARRVLGSVTLNYTQETINLRTPRVRLDPNFFGLLFVKASIRFCRSLEYKSEPSKQANCPVEKFYHKIKSQKVFKSNQNESQLGTRHTCTFELRYEETQSDSIKAKYVYGSRDGSVRQRMDGR
jgi:hypothetical protein